jgi:predicted amidohydrolase
VVDPWGTIVAQSPDTGGIVRANLDLDRVTSIRRQIPALANRRPAAYRTGG